MKLNILKLILWLKSGNIRELVFEPEKINLITGNPGTGKTDILHIIYYCLFDDEVKITESIINENVNWYGIQIELNNHLYTICRKSIADGKSSSDYFFSSTGEIPSFPKVNNTKNDIKSVVETEFSISKDTNIPFGGNYINANSKISLNYLLILNAIDVSIIENPNVYVAFQDKPRYKEALERIFDLCMGIETVENILARSKYKDISDRINQLNRKQDRINCEKILFQEELQSIINKLKGYGFIQENLNLDESIKAIDNLLLNLASNKIYTEKSIRSDLESELAAVQNKLRNLVNFQGEYQKYQKTKQKNFDSLLPIECLRKKDDELVKTSIFEDIFNAYEKQIFALKKITSKKSPINNQIRDEQINLENKKRELEKQLENLPVENTTFESDKEKFYFLGQVKSKFDLYKTEKSFDDYSKQIQTLKEQLSCISVNDILLKREISRVSIENYIKNYMEIISASLENYKNYIPYFDMKNKCLQFINPTKSAIEAVGSSSNHMFMQLLFSLGVHQLAFVNGSKFLAPLLIIDQPSRPYFGTKNEKKNIASSDEAKIKNAFVLLDQFIAQRHLEKGSFQMIVLEHIPKEYVDNLSNVHVVEEFLNGNALIPHSEYETKSRGLYDE